MKEKLSGVKLHLGASEEKLKEAAQKKLHAPLRYFKILKKSLDARDKGKICYVYTIEFSAERETEEDPLAAKPCGVKNSPERVLVVGAGPAGLFCAVRLLQYGICPLVVERGGCVEERVRDVDEFFAGGKLRVDSNIQFGEGGAGTFSDGKLNTQTNSAENAEVLRMFAAFGAPEEVTYLNKPHVGSDKLRAVVKNMREYVIARGGEIRFHTALSDLDLADGKVKSVTLSNGEKIPVSEVVLAIGHSARDTFSMLERKGIWLEQKEFAVGFRIEHLQEKIGFAQYGADYKILPPADYKLTSHVSDRAAFTFCMCPGGYVMPATSEEGQVVTNGMSNYAREGMNANAALIAQVRKSDFGSDAPLSGVEFQRRIERAAFLAGGRNYAAPVQRVEDFLCGRASSGAGEVLPSYQRGVLYTDLSALLPEEIINTIRAAIPDMGRRLRGFDSPDAILTGVEARTSSPVRILRGEEGESVNAKGLYPCGEGAGYAGGITSAAADGLRTAKRIAMKYGAE